jgi:hypothetical protein
MGMPASSPGHVGRPDSAHRFAPDRLKPDRPPCRQARMLHLDMKALARARERVREPLLTALTVVMAALTACR